MIRGRKGPCLSWYNLAISSYKQRQYDLFRELEEKLRKGESPATTVTPVSDYAKDTRMSLALVAFLPMSVQQIIVDKVQNPLKVCDSRQYFYLPESLHITIQSIRTSHNPPLFNNEDIDKVNSAFSEIIPKFGPLAFELEGLFELPTSLSVQALAEEELRNLAATLRTSLIEIGVPDDKAYASNKVVFGNTTVSRYTTDPSNNFQEKIKELKNIYIGSLVVRKVSLITGNSVCHPNTMKVIKTYYLSSSSPVG